MGASVKDAALQALARREFMRRHFMPYVLYFRKTYLAGWVHQLVARRLERFSHEVEQQLSPRLMLLMPPRHGKSTLSSEEFPGWHLGRCPQHEFISASYNISLPVGFSRKIRMRMRDPEYQAIFPQSRLDPDSQSVETWNLVQGGSYLAAGVGGGITGKGAHIASIDDPIKNAEEADSATVLDAIWDWYGSTFYSRLAPGGGVLITQTWWSDGDPAGRIQEQMKDDPEADQFEVIRFPAIAEEDEYLIAGDTIWRESDDTAKPDDAQLLRSKGDPLHPERYTLKALLQRKKNTQPRHWSALYQQNPAPDEGIFFTKSMFKKQVMPVLGDRHIYQAWDFAITEKQANDWTVGATGALDIEDNLIALDQDRFKLADSMLIVDRMLDAYVKWNPLVIGVEDGQIWKALKSYFFKRCQDRHIYPVVEELVPVSDKAARARPLQGRMRQGRVIWPTDAPWFEKMQREFLRFQSGGLHDDQVDTWAWLARLVIDQAPPKPREERPKSWRDDLNQFLVGNEAGTGHMAA